METVVDKVARLVGTEVTDTRIGAVANGDPNTGGVDVTVAGMDSDLGP